MRLVEWWWVTWSPVYREKKRRVRLGLFKTSYKWVSTLLLSLKYMDRESSLTQYWHTHTSSFFLYLIIQFPDLETNVMSPLIIWNRYKRTFGVKEWKDMYMTRNYFYNIPSSFVKIKVQNILCYELRKFYQNPVYSKGNSLTPCKRSQFTSERVETKLVPNELCINE